MQAFHHTGGLTWWVCAGRAWQPSPERDPTVYIYYRTCRTPPRPWSLQGCLGTHRSLPHSVERWKTKGRVVNRQLGQRPGHKEPPGKWQTVKCLWPSVTSGGARLGSIDSTSTVTNSDLSENRVDTALLDIRHLSPWSEWTFSSRSEGQRGRLGVEPRGIAGGRCHRGWRWTERPPPGELLPWWLQYRVTAGTMKSIKLEPNRRFNSKTLTHTTIFSHLLILHYKLSSSNKMLSGNIILLSSQDIVDKRYVLYKSSFIQLLH